MSTATVSSPSKPLLQRIAPYQALDIFRGLAALWVVMRHSVSSWPLLSAELASHPAYLYRFSLRGQLGVCIFFVISGYCITGAAYGALVSGKPVRRYAWERVRRIYPPYLAAILLGIVSIEVRGFATAHHLVGDVHHLFTLSRSPRFWTGNLLLAQIPMRVEQFNVVFWSLCYEFFFYAVIGVFLAVSKTTAKLSDLSRGTWVFVSLMLASTWLSLSSLLIFDNAVFPFDKWHQFSIGGILFFVLEFGPATVARYSNGLRNLTAVGFATCVALMLAFAALRSHTSEIEGNLDSSRLRTIVCLAFVLLLLVLRRYDRFISSSRLAHPLLWLGGSSYSLYLSHTIFLPYVSIVCRRVGLDGSRYWITFWLGIAVSVVLGRVFYRAIESHFISSRQKRRLELEGVQ